MSSLREQADRTRRLWRPLSMRISFLTVVLCSGIPGKMPSCLECLLAFSSGGSNVKEQPWQLSAGGRPDPTKPSHSPLKTVLQAPPSDATKWACLVVTVDQGKTRPSVVTAEQWSEDCCTSHKGISSFQANLGTCCFFYQSFVALIHPTPLHGSKKNTDILNSRDTLNLYFPTQSKCLLP